MAFLDGPFNFRGKLGNLVAYQQKDTGKTIIQRKGGPTKKMIKNLPQYERTRLLNSEFSACSQASSAIRDACYPMDWLADRSLAGRLTAFCKKLQDRDPENGLGERGVYFSHHGHLLTGFNFNKHVLFDSVVKNPISFTHNRDNATATVTLPELIPDLNLSLPWTYPFYQFILSLGVVTDIAHTKHGFHHYDRDEMHIVARAETEWQHAEKAFAGQTFELQLAAKKSLEEYHTMVLAVGFQMGAPHPDYGIWRAQNAGCGKILHIG